MLIEKEETQSTNDDARELAMGGAPSGTAVLAKRQTQGRGRAGRTFESPTGGMYLSVVLRPTTPPTVWSLLSLGVAAEAANALRGFGFDARIKWPNDVILEGRKVGGILAESRLGESPFVVVGIGLNLERAPEDVPEATSLAAHGTAPPARALALLLVDGFTSRLRALEHGGAPATLREVRSLCVTLGKRVEWEGSEGLAVDIADDGALVVLDEKGNRHRIVAGDVRVRQR